MKLLKFNDWANENLTHKRPTKKITDLDINRRFKKDPFTGDKYETELFAMFKRLQPRIQALEKKPNLDEWFEMMQNSDNQFYAMVQAEELGQPDVRELWRDLTGQRASKMAKYGLAESLIDPSWKVVFTDSTELAEHFAKFGIAFSHLEERMIYIDSAEFERHGLTQDHQLAIEAHEIAHGRLGHHGDFIDPVQERQADETAIQILRSMGHHSAGDLLAERLVTEAKKKSIKIKPSDSIFKEEAEGLTDEYRDWTGPNGETIVSATGECADVWVNADLDLSNGTKLTYEYEWSREISIEKLTCVTVNGPIEMSEEMLDLLDDASYDLQVDRDITIRVDLSLLYWACLQTSDRIPAELLKGMPEDQAIGLMKLGLYSGPASETTSAQLEIPHVWLNRIIMDKFC
jgi:hypothetical protein